MTRLSLHQLLVAVSLCLNVDATLRGGVAGFLEDVFDQNMKVKTIPALGEVRNQTLDIDPEFVKYVVEKKNKTDDSIMRGEVDEFIGAVFDTKEDVKGDIPADVDPDERLDDLYSNVTTNEDNEKSGGMASNRSDTNKTKCPSGVRDDSFSDLGVGRTKSGKKGSKVGDHDDDLASVTTSEDVEISGGKESNSSKNNITKCPKGVSGDLLSARGVKGKKGGKKGGKKVGKIDVYHEDDDGVFYGKGKGESGDGTSYGGGCSGEGCGENLGGSDWDGYQGEGMNYGKGTELGKGKGKDEPDYGKGKGKGEPGKGNCEQDYGKGKGKGELDYGKGKGAIVDDDDAYFYDKGKGRGKKG